MESVMVCGQTSLMAIATRCRGLYLPGSQLRMRNLVGGVAVDTYRRLRIARPQRLSMDTGKVLCLRPFVTLSAGGGNIGAMRPAVGIGTAQDLMRSIVS